MSDVPRCPQCGCNDLDERDEGGSLWGVPARAFQCNHCDSRFQIARDDVPQINAVRFERLRCPHCDSPRTHITSTRRKAGEPTERYHACDDCELPFKSIEC